MITVVIGRAVQFLLALAMMRVATTLLSPEEMGRVSLLVTTTAFFALFLVNPVGMFVNRRLHAWQTSGIARQYLISYTNYLLAIAIIAGLSVYLLNMSGLANFGVSTSWLMLLVCGSLLFNTLNQTVIPSLNLLGDSGRFIVLSVATIATSFAFAAILVKFVEPTAHYWLLGLLIGQTLLGIVGTKVLFTRLNTPRSIAKTPITRQHVQALFSFAWPVAIAAGSVWIQGQGYRYVMGAELGLDQLGLFVAGYSISAGIIAGFESVLTTYFQPRLYRDTNTTHQTIKILAWQRYATAVIPSTILTTAFIINLAPELTRIFLGTNFQSAAQYIVWAAIAESARVVISVYSLIAHVHMRTRWLIAPNIFGAIISISLCAFFIPKFGAMGAGIGLVASGFAVVLAMHVFLAKNVEGGPSTRPILTAIFYSASTWGAMLILKKILNLSKLIQFNIYITAVGTVYILFLYLLLKKSISTTSLTNK